MHEVRQSTTASPADVFAVLADGWLYPIWVVGASRVRAVDTEWPEPGSRLHHSFGVWPLVIDDVTEVLERAEPNRLVLKAKGWPVGEARVELRIDPQETGSLITITEDATTGPGRLVPKAIRQALIATRNRETLNRLALIAEGRPQKPDR